MMIDDPTAARDPERDTKYYVFHSECKMFSVKIWDQE